MNEKNRMLAIDFPAKLHYSLPSSAKEYNKLSIIAKTYEERKKETEKEEEIVQNIFHIVKCHQILIKGNHYQMFRDLVYEKCNHIQMMGLDRHQFLRNVKREMKIFHKYTKQNSDMILQHLDWFRERLFDIFVNSNPYNYKAITQPKSLKKVYSIPSAVVPRKLEFEETGEDFPNTISNIVTIRGGIVTYSPYLMTLCCNTIDGGIHTVHCPSSVTDMTRIDEDTVLATIPFRQKILIINPSSYETKTLDYSFHKISYLEHCKFVGLELFGKTIYLVDWADNTVEKIIDLEDEPENITVGPQHRLLLAFSNVNRIACYNLSGRQLFQVYTHSIDIPTDITASRNYFYAVQGNVIYRISSTGAVSQRENKIKARYISCGTNTIFLLDVLGTVYTVKTNNNFWPRGTYCQQVRTPTLKSQIHIEDPYEIKDILPMSASSILFIYRNRQAKLFNNKGQVICRSPLMSTGQPFLVCRMDSNRFLVLYQEDRKLQYISCLEQTKGHFIDVHDDYFQICHMLSNKYLALTIIEKRVELHILLIEVDKVDIIKRISLKHNNVIIAATPINFVVADIHEHMLVFYSTSGEELFEKYLDANLNPHHIYSDKIYFYVVFKMESIVICYDIYGERKWQLKLPSTAYSHIAVFQGTVYAMDIVHNRILLYKYHDWSSCCLQIKNPYIKNLDIRLKDNVNDKILIAKMCQLPGRQFVVSSFNYDCLLYISNEGGIRSTLSLPSTATDICRWDLNQIGVTLPLEKQLWVIGNLSNRIRIISLSHPYVWVRKLKEHQILCYWDNLSRLDIVSIQNHNQGEIICTINIPFIKSLSIEKETQNVLIVTKKKVLLYKTTTTSNSSNSKMVSTVLMSQVKSSPSFYGGCIDKLFVYLIDNSRTFAINEHDLVVKDHFTNKQLNMHIDFVDVFSRNICVGEMLSSKLYLQDLTVTDKARYVVVPQPFGVEEQVDSHLMVITENNLIAVYEYINNNIKILTFDGQFLDSIEVNVFPTYMCRWQSNTLVITTGNECQLLTLKVEFPLSLVTYQAEKIYNGIASLSDNLLVCCSCSSSSDIHVKKPTLSIVDIDEIHSTVDVIKEVEINKTRGDNDISDVTVTADDVIIVIGESFISFFDRNVECLRSVQHHMSVSPHSMTIDDSYLYVCGRWTIQMAVKDNRIVCLLQTGKYQGIFLSTKHSHETDFTSINCNGPRFLGNHKSYLYVEGLFKLNRERFPICRLQSDVYPVQVKDFDISQEGQVVVCEKINTGNVKVLQSNGELLCYRDLGTLVGGVCFTGETDILVTVPYRQEILQLNQQNLANHKVWQSQVPYGVIWRKVENIYWCVHINLTEYYTVEIDGDQLKVLEYTSLLKLDSGLRFPPITSRMNNEIFSNELINKLKYCGEDEGGKSGKIADKGRLKMRCGNYIAETVSGSDEISVRRLPYRKAMFPLSIPTSNNSVHYYSYGDHNKLIMLQDNVAVIMLRDILIVTNTSGDILQQKVIQKTPRDICWWTEECFIVLLQQAKQLMFFNRDLSHLKTINTKKYCKMIYRKNNNQLVCGGYTINYRGQREYYVEVVDVHGETCEYSHEVWSGEDILKRIGVTSSGDIVIVKKAKVSYADVSWYREGLIRSLQLQVKLSDQRNNLLIHDNDIYISDTHNDIYQLSQNSEQQLFLRGEDNEVHTILGANVSENVIVLFGAVPGLQNYCFVHYER